MHAALRYDNSRFLLKMLFDRRRASGFNYLRLKTEMVPSMEPHPCTIKAGSGERRPLAH